MKKLKKPDKYHTPETRSSIKKWLKEEKTKKQISALLGFNKKIIQSIIDRWELEENLLIPKLSIVR